MRKYLIMSGIIIAILGILILGYRCGIRHAIVDSEMFVTEFDDDVLEIFIELDGNVYTHDCYVG